MLFPPFKFPSRENRQECPPKLAPLISYSLDSYTVVDNSPPPVFRISDKVSEKSVMTISNKTDIDRQQVLHNIGCDTEGKLPARIESLINEYLENAHYLIEPSYSCVIRDVKLVHGTRVVIEGSVVFQSEVIARLLEQCEKAAVLLVTIGSHLEEMVCQLTKDGLMLQATVLDAIGSVATENLVDFVQSRVGEIARTQGLCISRRFSPGYCDWDVSQQKMVFRAVNGDSVGVRLTEGSQMFPRKSISGIIGIGSREVENYNPCLTCDKYDCVGRR